MVSIRKRIIEGKEYFYLEHSIREGSRTRKKELYLGTEIPKEIEPIKKYFMTEIYRDQWHEVLDKIKEGFSQEIKSMPKSLREKELESFMVKFTYDTQRIEGSRLTLRETANLLERNLTPKEKPLRDVKEAEAHKQVFYEMVGCKEKLSLNLILHWHKKLFQDTKPALAGRIRTHGVAISGSRFVPPSPVEITPLLKDFFRWYAKDKDKTHPVELAALVHLKLVTIHPFGDGNGRITRLLMNFILKRYNFPLLDISYQNRNSYYTALERAQVKNKEHTFVWWFIKNYIKENKRYVK